MDTKRGEGSAFPLSVERKRGREMAENIKTNRSEWNDQGRVTAMDWPLAGEEGRKTNYSHSSN